MENKSFLDLTDRLRQNRYHNHCHILYTMEEMEIWWLVNNEISNIIIKRVETKAKILWDTFSYYIEKFLVTQLIINSAYQNWWLRSFPFKSKLDVKSISV